MQKNIQCNTTWFRRLQKGNRISIILWSASSIMICTASFHYTARNIGSIICRWPLWMVHSFLRQWSILCCGIALKLWFCWKNLMVQKQKRYFKVWIYIAAKITYSKCQKYIYFGMTMMVRVQEVVHYSKMAFKIFMCSWMASAASIRTVPVLWYNDQVCRRRKLLLIAL